jgi:acyl-CoA-binding protein
MSDELKARFEAAQGEVQRLARRPSDDELLKLYGLYKQATQGDARGARPGMLDFRGRAKFDAWKAVEGLDADDAMSGYVNAVSQLVARYGIAGG